MRPIHLARLDKVRPAVLLTRRIVVPHLKNVTVAPIRSIARGLTTEVPVSPANGLDKDCVISLDNIQTIPKDNLLRRIGFFLPQDEQALAAAIAAAFDLDFE